ncbi:hypothetical protein ACJ6WF_49385 [Streptomyces sp. MMS24-I2-30]|uniref:hypothetical protein n=1 Tax=Streptomyces sp. MMS24-I2-30 TaxID=3351564 RepID=UPI00389699E4
MTTAIMTRALPRTTGQDRHTLVGRALRAGLQETIEDVTTEDDLAGLEPDDAFSRVLAAVNSHRSPRPRLARRHDSSPAAALGEHLLDVVRRQDAAIPAGRRAPRTVADMRARLAALYEEEQDACGLCGSWLCDGKCGQPESVSVPALAPASSGAGQCSKCGDWYDDWNGGVCDFCSNG